MKNSEIIMRNAIDLMNDGILAGVMEQYTDRNGNTVEVEMPEDIHTFDEWKKLGRIVRKGEHAIAKFPIWSPTKKTQKLLDDNNGKLDGEKKKEAKMYLRNAAWFKVSQTMTLEEAQAQKEAEKAEKAKVEVLEEAKPKKTAKTAPKKTTKKTADTKKTTAKPKKSDTKKPVTTAPKSKAKKTAPKKSEPKKTAEPKTVTKTVPASMHAVCAKNSVPVGENYYFC